MRLCHHRKDGRGCGVHVDQLQVADPDLGPRRPRLPGNQHRINLYHSWTGASTGGRTAQQNLVTRGANCTHLQCRFNETTPFRCSGFAAEQQWQQ